MNTFSLDDPQAGKKIDALVTRARANYEAAIKRTSCPVCTGRSCVLCDDHGMVPTPRGEEIRGAVASLDADEISTHDAFERAGYSLRLAAPVWFHRGRCYGRELGGGSFPGTGIGSNRLVIRDGRIVGRTRNATHANDWLRRLAARL